MARMACAASSSVASRAVAKRCGSAVWSITPTDQPSGSSQIVRIALPSTFMASNLPAGQAYRNLAPVPAGEPCMAAIDYEAEYNNRARVPEHEEIFAGWVRDGEL